MSVKVSEGVREWLCAVCGESGVSEGVCKWMNYVVFTWC
jgi:hypothetical protein